ncbi:hypothetical protein QAD02_006050 [Eretmocerus hayati]|uniref:Uncharacterized protein n=1 Tax=Eretmocerus hayati TaxID=131215 RepID=A0ACC2MZY2_9HYME|nr:hypothetical protein QAD02_006050 [Eretmocerus hayati]
MLGQEWIQFWQKLQGHHKVFVVDTTKLFSMFSECKTTRYELFSCTVTSLYDQYHDEINDILETVEEDIDVDVQRLSKRYVRDFQNPFEWYRGHEFTKRYRFSKDVVMFYILPLIEDKLQWENNRGLPVPPPIQLTIGLRYYATGHFQREIGDLHGFSQSYAGSYTEFLLLLLNCYMSIAGVIDGVQIEIISPGKSIGGIFRNRKGYFSINVLIVVDNRGRILHIDVRNPGSVHDSTCVDRSGLNIIFIEYRVEGNLVGDNGFANLPYLLTAFDKPTDEAQKLYNKCIISTRNVVERIFGGWKQKFQCLKGIILYHIDNTISIICATAVLWNIHIDLKLPIEQDLQNIVFEEAAFTVPARPGTNGLRYRLEFVRRHFQR